MTALSFRNRTRNYLSACGFSCGFLPHYAIIFSLKMPYVYHVCCIYHNALQNTLYTEANFMNFDQTSPIMVHIVCNLGFRNTAIRWLVNGSKHYEPGSEGSSLVMVYNVILSFQSTSTDGKADDNFVNSGKEALEGIEAS